MRACREYSREHLRYMREHPEEYAVLRMSFE
jgi:hypothetical protein